MIEPAPRKRRLFVGVDLDRRARAACAAVSEELRRTGFDARYEAIEKLHMTLAFLGFVEPSRHDQIVSALASAAARAEAFAISLDKLSAFPHERTPRIVYIGAREAGARFRTLTWNLRNAYTGLGFDFRSDAVAHVTIARAKAAKRPLPLIDVSSIALRIQTLALFESLPDPANRTSRYQIVARANFLSD